jgi:hypothetical protein
VVHICKICGSYLLDLCEELNMFENGSRKNFGRTCSAVLDIYVPFVKNLRMTWLDSQCNL